jgi:hypothetical protein
MGSVGASQRKGDEWQVGGGVEGTAAIRKMRQLGPAFAVRLPQEAFSRAIETTCFLWHRRQITLRSNARIRSRAKVGVHVSTFALVPIFVDAHIETSVQGSFRGASQAAPTSTVTT